MNNTGSAYLMVLVTMLTLTLWAVAAIFVTFAGRVVSMRYPPYGGMYDLSVSAIHLLYNDLLEQAAGHHSTIMDSLYGQITTDAIVYRGGRYTIEPPGWFTSTYRDMVDGLLENRRTGYQLTVTEERWGVLHTDTYTIEGTHNASPILGEVRRIASEARLGDSVFMAEAIVRWPDLPVGFEDEVLPEYSHLPDGEGGYVLVITGFEILYRPEFLTLELTRVQRVME